MLFRWRDREKLDDLEEMETHNLNRNAVLALLIASRNRRRRRKKFIKMWFSRLRSNEEQFIEWYNLVQSTCEPRVRSCLRLPRNQGWWTSVQGYTDQRFKSTFRMSREIFGIVLNNIEGDITHHSSNGDAVPPDVRLGIALYRLARGDYYYTLAEMSGIGEATICTITQEVCNAIIKNMWREYVHDLFPKTDSQFSEAIAEMESRWQMVGIRV